MKDQEIIERTYCCAYADDCERCPQNDCEGVEQNLLAVLGIIDRQKAEINRLEREIQCLVGLNKMYSAIRTEAVREFAERLRKEIRERPTHSMEQNRNVLHYIDNLVKEMEK